MPWNKKEKKKKITHKPLYHLHYIQIISFGCRIKSLTPRYSPRNSHSEERIIHSSALSSLCFLIQNFYIKQSFFWQNHCGDSFHCENYHRLWLWVSTQCRVVLKYCKECKKFLYYFSDKYSLGLISPFILFSEEVNLFCMQASSHFGQYEETILDCQHASRGPLR